MKPSLVSRPCFAKQDALTAWERRKATRTDLARARARCSWAIKVCARSSSIAAVRYLVYRAKVGRIEPQVDLSVRRCSHRVELVRKPMWAYLQLRPITILPSIRGSSLAMTKSGVIRFFLLPFTVAAGSAWCAQVKTPPRVLWEGGMCGADERMLYCKNSSKAGPDPVS